NISHEIESGRYPAKGIVGDEIKISADIFSDGHDEIGCCLQIRAFKERKWVEYYMDPVSNDMWIAGFVPSKVTTYEFSIHGWINHFATFNKDLHKYFLSGKDLSVDLEMGLNIFDYYINLTTNTLSTKIKKYKKIYQNYFDKPDMNLFTFL